MLDLFGRGYVIEHCVSAFLDSQRDYIFRAYSTEMLRLIAKRLGYDVQYKFSDLVPNIIDMREQKPTPQADDVISNIRNKLAGMAVSDIGGDRIDEQPT